MFFWQKAIIWTAVIASFATVCSCADASIISESPVQHPGFVGGENDSSDDQLQQNESDSIEIQVELKSNADLGPGELSLTLDDLTVPLSLDNVPSYFCSIPNAELSQLLKPPQRLR
jgi:hypothetical protein